MTREIWITRVLLLKRQQMWRSIKRCVVEIGISIWFTIISSLLVISCGVVSATNISITIFVGVSLLTLSLIIVVMIVIRATLACNLTRSSILIAIPPLILLTSKLLSLHSLLLVRVDAAHWCVVIWAEITWSSNHSLIKIILIIVKHIQVCLTVAIQV